VALYTPEERDEVASLVLDLLREDERIAQAELSGSGTTGYADRWSDVDLFVTVAEGIVQAEVADDWTRRLYHELPVVHHFAVAFGEHHVRGFLLENLLEVDIGFQPAVEEQGEWPDPNPEREAGYAWHDALHAGVAIARGRPWRARYYIGFLLWRTLKLATHRVGAEFGEFKGVDELPRELLTPLDEALGAGGLAEAARTATQAFLDELRRHRPDLADRLESPLLEFLDEAA
jgi:predicted nucleotidyltransferase